MSISFKQLMSFPESSINVPLPSKGRGYPENSTIYGKDSIKIKRYSAEQEDILGDVELIKEGKFIDVLLQSIVLENIDIRDLFPEDKTALLIASRANSIDSKYKTMVTCKNESCGHKHNGFEFDLNEFETREPNYDNASEAGENLYSTKLPACNAEVLFKVLNGHELEEIQKERIECSVKGRPFSETKAELRKMIQQIVFIHDSERIVASEPIQIKEVIDYMIAKDIKYLKARYKEVQASLELSKVHKCPKCGEANVVEVPLRGEFFWPEQ